MVEDLVIEIKGGRHPVIDQLLGEGEQYVPNDTLMDVSQQVIFSSITACTYYIIECACSLFVVEWTADHGDYRPQHGRKELLHQTGRLALHYGSNWLLRSCYFSKAWHPGCCLFQVV